MDFDPYRILGISSDATELQVRQAYRAAAKRCHPDAGGSHEAMIDVIAAWKILCDPEKRAAYDRQRAQPQDAGAQSQWSSVAEEARTEAQAAVPQTPKDWADFWTWLDDAAGEVQANAAGRFAAGAVSGIVLGLILGALSGWLIGIGALGGAGVGALVGGLAGGITTVRKRPLSP